MPDIPIPAINECAIAFDIDDGKFIFISSGVSLVLGYPVADFYKNNNLLYEIIHPLDKADVKLTTDNLIEGKVLELNYRIITAAGVVKQIHEKRDLTANQDTGHKIIFSIITEQPAEPAKSSFKRAVSDKLDKSGITGEIKKTTKKLDVFIESITDAFFLLDKEWRFVKVNAAFESVFNKTRDEVTGSLFFEIFPGVESTNFWNACGTAVSENEMMKFTACFEPLKKWFDTTVYPSPEGMTIFAKNITDEKRVNEELIWTKNSLEGLINNTDDQIWSVDGDLNYVYINNSYRNRLKQLGIEPKKGEPFQNSRRSQAITNKWKKFYERAFKGEVYTIVDKGVDPATKGLLNFEVSFHPIVNSDNVITGVGCLAKNITQRLKTEKAIVEQNGRLRLVASLTSHELRRPVASLLGLLNIIDRTNIYNPDNFEIMDHLFTVGNEIDEVIRLIINETFTDDLLNEDYKKDLTLIKAGTYSSSEYYQVKSIISPRSAKNQG